METTVRPHKRMLRRICALGQVLGWALIVGGTMAVSVDAFMVIDRRILAFDPSLSLQGVLRDGMEGLGAVLTGLALLGVVQFIRYALEDDAKPGWILRNGHILLGIIAAFMVLSWAAYDWPRLTRMMEAQLIRTTAGIVVVYGVSLLPAVGKGLAFVGIAVTLRAVLPIMAESKTLA